VHQEEGDAIAAVRSLRKRLTVVTCFVLRRAHDASHSFRQLHPSSTVIDNYDCKYGGVSEEEGVPFVTEFEYLLDELVEIIWTWVVTCVSINCFGIAITHSHVVLANTQVLPDPR
jgi:hypothetical protein